MFKQTFIKLCSQKGESPSSVCNKVGISAAAFSQWTDKTIPRKVTQQRIADYFGVTVDYLLGKEVLSSPLGSDAPDAQCQGASALSYTDDLYRKIACLDDVDRGKVEGFVTGLLAANKYRTVTKHKGS